MVGRYLRKNNIISYNETPGRHLVTEDRGRGRQEVIERFGRLRQFVEPVAVSRYHPVNFKLGMKTTLKEQGKEVTTTRPINIDATYGNDLVYFSNRELDSEKGFIKPPPVGYRTVTDFYLRGGLSDPSTPIESFISFTYKESLYPREANTYSYKARGRNLYTNKFWKDSEIERRVLGQSKINFVGTTADSLDAASGEAMTGPASKRSSWNLDGLLSSTYTTASVSIFNVLTGSETGILQDHSAFLHHGSKASITASCVYARPHLLPATASVRSLTGPVIAETGSASMIIAGNPIGRMKIYGGITQWEAGEQAGKIDANGLFVSSSAAPFYNNYSDYVDDVRTIAKDYSLVPEFRISEHVEYYVKNKQGNFLAKNPKLLSIAGSPTGSTAVPQNSSENDFFAVYSTSDFMKHFDVIRNEHKEVANPTEITLTCKAAMKFLPYDGFYPSERTVEIATQFSKSYAEFCTFAGDDKDLAAARMRPLIAPLFAPGVLFNTIKSGIACDYPIYTSSFKRNQVVDHGSSEVSSYILIATSSNPPVDSGQKLAGWDLRVPFESLITPEKYISNTPMVDMEVHPSAALVLSASWDGRGDALYSMMASNFLAEVPEFFLPNEEFTTLKSQPEKQFKAFEVGSTYGMRIKIRKSYNKSRQNGRIGRYFVPQDTPLDHTARNLRETFTMYSRPSAFGPPISGRGKDIGQGTVYNRVKILDSLRGINPSFTPPYYDGEAWCDILFQPSSSFVSLDDILGDSKKVYWRFDKLTDGWGGASANNTHPYGNININKYSMQLSSSFNLFQKVIEPVAEFDKDGNPIGVKPGTAENSTWVIQPKFETPMYNFADSGVHPIKASTGTLTVPTNNSESVTRGMWHQFGVIPTDPSRGIFLEVTEIPKDFINTRVPLFVSSAGDTDHSIDQNSSAYDDRNYNSYYGGGRSIKSLLDVVTFKEKSVKLGQTANKKIVREAVVAVPFIEEAGSRKFFNIDKDLVSEAVKNPDSDLVGDSIKNLVDSMSRFVIPPTMDFLSFPDKVDPISMYIFEFEYEFTQNDLVHIWQNLMPPSGKIVKKAEAKVSHKLLLNEIFGNVSKETSEPINDKLKWMVFKVKQKANTSYYSKVAGFDTDADPRFKFAFQAGRASPLASAEEQFGYNWPYDFFSLVELVKLESEIKFSPMEEDIDPKLVIKTDEELVSAGVQKNVSTVNAGSKIVPRK